MLEVTHLSGDTLERDAAQPRQRRSISSRTAQALGSRQPLCGSRRSPGELVTSKRCAREPTGSQPVGGLERRARQQQT
jgi:hypothetical protein